MIWLNVASKLFTATSPPPLPMMILRLNSVTVPPLESSSLPYIVSSSCLTSALWLQIKPPHRLPSSSFSIFSRRKLGLIKAYTRGGMIPEGASYFLSWRLAVEANNARGWGTVPSQCLSYIEAYMIGGQYDRDLDLIVDQILSYINKIVPSDDGAMDAWILDVDDTCISNLVYYKGKRYGCDPFDPAGFKAWALKGGCPAIPAVLGLFKCLVRNGFKVFLITGRDQETLGQATTDNLQNQGFIGYERLIFKTAGFKGQSASAYKSEIRRRLEKEGYRIVGNVGDQWSDLQGECLGSRAFKLPNPMYFVP